MTSAAAVTARWQRLRLPLAIGAGLTSALWLVGTASLGTLHRYLGAEAALAVVLSRTRLTAGDGQSCVLIGDSRLEALGEWSGRCRVFNLARSGSRAANWRAHLPLLRAGLPPRSQLAVWMGINDLTHKHAPPQVVADDLVAVVSELSRAGHAVYVLPQLATHTNDPRRASVSADSARVDALVRGALAGTPRVSFVEPRALGVPDTGAEPSFYRDGVHLSNASSARLRSVLDRVFESGAAQP